MAMFTKETALEVAYIGAGAVAGTIVGSKVYQAIPDTVTSKLGTYAPYVEGAIPVVIGLFLPSVAGRSTIVRGLANGMIAAGSSKIVQTAFDTISSKVPNAAGSGQGVGNVMMGNVMMGNVIQTPLMGATEEGYNTYSDTSYDFTGADAGEMDY